KRGSILRSAGRPLRTRGSRRGSFGCKASSVNSCSSPTDSVSGKCGGLFESGFMTCSRQEFECCPSHVAEALGAPRGFSPPFLCKLLCKVVTPPWLDSCARRSSLATSAPGTVYDGSPKWPPHDDRCTEFTYPLNPWQSRASRLPPQHVLQLEHPH